MTWVQSTKRWKKMHRGALFVVSCRQLFAPETKMESMQLANEWWIAKRAEIDSAGKSNSYDDRMNRLGDFLEATTGTKLGSKVGDWTKAIEKFLTNASLTPVLAQVGKTQEQMLDLVLDGVEQEKKVGHWFDLWVKVQHDKVSSGKIKAMRADSNRRMLFKFVEWIGKDVSVSSINEECLDRFYAHLVAQKWSDTYRAGILVYVRAFIEYMAERKALVRPENLRSKDHSFNYSAGEIKVWSVNEIRTILAGATGQTRLHCLLGLNCGMTMKDISDLSDKQVDWKHGRITRKRSKTEKKKNTPVVTYQLWSETFALLREYRSGGDIVLLRPDGSQWDTQEIDGQGKLKRKVSHHIPTLLRDLGIAGSQKMFRASAATLLGTHPEYKFYAQYFLGHAPQNEADGHYVRPDNVQFFAALDWLETAIFNR